MLFFHTIFGYVCFFFSSRLRHTTSAFVTVVLTCDLPICAERDILSAADGCAVGELSVALWTAYDLREPLQPLAQGGSLGEDITGCISGLRGRYPDDRQLVDPGSPARRQRQKKDGRSRCMDRSRGGLTTKIHALEHGRASWRERVCQDV